MDQLFKGMRTPYICVPLTGKTKQELYDQLDVIVTKHPDMLEWRADFFAGIDDTEEVINLANYIKERSQVPLLFTIRSHKEGGEAISLTEDEKVNLVVKVCEDAKVDLIDYETKNKREHIETLRDAAEKHDKKFILSYHNFTETPENNELIKLAVKAEVFGAHISKFAVMPNTQDDVLRLLSVTKTIDDLLDIPVVTMSMGDIGGLSRIVGWAYGSMITFGVGVELSAPGQIPVEKLREVLNSSRDLVSSWE